MVSKLCVNLLYCRLAEALYSYVQLQYHGDNVAIRLPSSVYFATARLKDEVGGLVSVLHRIPAETKYPLQTESEVHGVGLARSFLPFVLRPKREARLP